MVTRFYRLGRLIGFRSIGACSLLVLPFAAAFLAGCAGSTGSGTGSIGGASTNVVLLASSTANDQLAEFSMTLTSLTLVDQSGKSVSLLASPVSDDFIHVNGTAEPLATVVVPQGTYTSAQASVEFALPECAGQGSGTLLIDESLNGASSSKVTVNMTQPITVAGTAMGLTLNLQVSASAPFSGGCSSSLTNAVQVAPVMNLTPMTIAGQPTNSTNGRMTGLRGMVTSVNTGGTGFTVNTFYSANADYPASWQIGLNGSTAIQGVSSASQVVVGMPVDMDVNIQSDGSLLATRVAVPDSNTTSLSIAYGPPLALYSSGGYNATYPVIDALQVAQDGYLSGGLGLYSFSGASFQTSSQLTNLQSLPFTPTFNAATMVDGQNILLTTHAPALDPNIASISDITLLPQTIDGTVSAVSTSGSFTTYTVTLAPYDLFPNLAVQTGQTTLLTNPNSVVVYADSSTQMLNNGPIAIGSPFRFYGLIFNDNGALRMDCAQISTGVTE